MSYVSLSELKAYLNISDELDNNELTLILAAATSTVEEYTGRTFSVADETTTQIYMPMRATRILAIHDLASSEDLTVLINGNEIDDIDLLPVPTASKPATALGSSYSFYGKVTVTGLFGWPAVPANVQLATLMLAARYYKRRYSPEGIINNADFGPIRVGRVDPDVGSLLGPYRLHYPKAW